MCHFSDRVAVRPGKIGRAVPRYGANELKTPAAHRADQRLRAACVAQRLAGGFDTASNGRVGHDAALPHLGDKVVPAEDAAGIVRQIHKQIEHQRFDMDCLAVPPQLVRVGVEFKTVKSVAHNVSDILLTCPWS
jgi:hypothetical protein